MSLSAALLPLCARVAYLAAAFGYAGLACVSDYQYGLGLRGQGYEHFEVAARLFPFDRSHRGGPAYTAIARNDASRSDDVLAALRYDPFAADLWFGLAKLRLKANDMVGYNAALIQLKALTPGVDYSVVATKK